MTYKFALVRDDEIVDIRTYDTLDGVATTKTGADGGLLLRTVVEDPQPSFDERTHTAKATWVIEPTQVVRTWELVARSAEDLDNVIRTRTRKAIEDGFVSSALGAPHTYPSNETDQQNINANVVSSILPGVDVAWRTHQLCADANGVWLYREHTAEQIQQVGTAGKAHVMACLLNGAAMRQTLMGGGSISLDAGWP
jgi:hypothetical protein